jgi:hypothetical protein
MPILAAGQRRYLFEKDPLYLFSYDAQLTETSRSGVPGGVAVDWSLDKQPDPDDIEPRQVYHVLDEETVNENDAVRGQVEVVRDSMFLPSSGRTAPIQGAAVLLTHDRAQLDAYYRGSVETGVLAIHQFNSVIAAKQDIQLRAFFGLRFETTFPKYKWLVETQCAGFGQLRVKAGSVVGFTIDIYAMR